MEQLNVSFKLKGIELNALNLNQPQIPLNSERGYNFNIDVEQRINMEEKLVIVSTTIDLIHEADKQTHASIKTSCIFLVENMQVFNSASDFVKLPDQFIVTLNSISLSTTRGIMFSQFKGTFMHNVFLPIVNPTALNTEKTFVE